MTCAPRINDLLRDERLPELGPGNRGIGTAPWNWQVRHGGELDPFVAPTWFALVHRKFKNAG